MEYPPQNAAADLSADQITEKMQKVLATAKYDLLRMRPLIGRSKKENPQ
jgi:hypothetical protein